MSRADSRVQLLFSAPLSFRSYWLKRKPTHDPEGNPQYPALSPMVMTQQLDRDDEPSQSQNGELMTERDNLQLQSGSAKPPRTLACHRGQIVLVGGLRPEAHKFT